VINNLYFSPRKEIIHGHQVQQDFQALDLGCFFWMRNAANEAKRMWLELSITKRTLTILPWTPRLMTLTFSVNLSDIGE
jgi:hypothetical protein